MWALKLAFLGVAIAMVQVSSSPIAPEQISAAIAELKDRLKNDLKMDYMKEDYWLQKWLNSKNYNVDETFKTLQEHLQFRIQERLDTILDEDWSDMRTIFPYSHNTIDKSGQPLLYYNINDWDLANYMAQNPESGYDRMLRYLMMMSEEAEAHVRQLRSEGQGISKYSYMVNFGGFSPSKHICIQCIQTMRKAAEVLTSYVPVHNSRTTHVNVPYLFKAIFTLFSGETQSYLTLYGQDRSQWEPLLLEHFERSQLPAGILSELGHRDNNEGSLMWKNQEL